MPIPGTKRIEYLESNVAAGDVRLTDEDRSILAEIFAPGAVTGARYGRAHSYGDSPLPA